MQLDRQESTLSIIDPKAWKNYFRMSQLTHTTQSTRAQENETSSSLTGEGITQSFDMFSGN